ncbi:hypothetical protein [Corallococcus terminator]|uniref:Uncharacterized protein n=1 Tax=Corallococcus terminator TaxID=2316733 RepID=A0A3A8JJI0_9BACT|nr:hypothetical protein [Corallococcus terminator]RKG90641.1 hypothetical protein D7V88_10790 [Corallococcus terminator]
MENRTRAWSIVAMSLLCLVLTYVLLRSPPHPGHREEPSPGEAPTRGNPYRGWPLFQGWPVPQPPDAKPEAPPAPRPER